MITTINEFRKLFESSDEGMTKTLEAFLAQFPDDATSWAQATDEIREVLFWMQENHDNVADIPIVGKKNCKTPSEWNTKYKAAIREGWTKLTSFEKQSLYNDYLQGWTKQDFKDWMSTTENHTINEMSYASLQSEIEDLKAQLAQLFQDQETEAGQKGDAWTDTDANRYGALMNKIERKIETRQNYINRLRSGSSRKSTPTKQLVAGEKINYKGEECTILYVVAPDHYDVVVKNTEPVVGLANTSDTTYQNKPVRVTNVENGNVFINTWKDGGGFNNFANKISIKELDGIIKVPYEELQEKPKERTQREPKLKSNMEVKQAIRTLTKNMDSVKPSIDKFKDRSPEQQATIFKSRFKMSEDITTIITALQEMGLIAAKPIDYSDPKHNPYVNRDDPNKGVVEPLN